jgi:hypothetical protein
VVSLIAGFDSRVAIIMVDYPRQARLKILGRVEIFEGENAEGWLDEGHVTRYSRRERLALS